LIDIAAVWQFSKDFLNSNFFTAIAGACAGAFAGAYGAQRIVARGKEKEELLAEIRNTNAATVVALGICNTFLAIKKQHVKRLKETFERQKADYLARAHQYRIGELPPGNIAPPLLFDLQVLVLPPFDLRMKAITRIGLLYSKRQNRQSRALEDGGEFSLGVNEVKPLLDALHHLS
jgi:hypothetical protein